MVILTKKGQDWLKPLGMAVTASNREILAIFQGLSPKMPKNERLKSRFLYRVL
jgi:hypothetical protein